MKCAELAYRLPGPLRRHILHFEAEIDDSVRAFAKELPTDALVLDAGAGEGQYARHFRTHRLIGVDLAVGDAGWDYGELDAVADLVALPFRDRVFEAAIHIVTIEHLPEPAKALEEIARTLKPGATLLVAAPHEWEVHQSPHDYFRYTRHGLVYLLKRAGFENIEIVPAGGYFRLLARRLLNGLQFFAGGARWLLFVPVALLVGPPAMILPFFDFLDGERNFTLGYIARARRRG